MICRTLCRQTKLLCLLAVTLAGLWSASTAQAVPAPVTNSGFELPGTGKTEYWDGAGNIVPGIIPGWEPRGIGLENAGGPAGGPGDSGIESDGTYGAWAGYLSALDPAIYNTTGSNVQTGNKVTLTFALNDAYTSNTNYSQILNQVYLAVRLYYDDGGPQYFASTTFGPVGYGYADHSIVGIVPGGVSGKPVGIEFDNVSNLLGSDAGLGPVVHSWLHLDNVRLDVMVPEPGSIVLLLLGGVGLMGLGRRR